jgi:hypothetical protein
VKGSIDITVLVVAIVPIVLLLIFASFFIAEESVKNSLYAEVTFNENSYQAMTAHSIVMNETVREKVGMFQFQDQETREGWNRSITLYAERVLSTHSRIYSFSAADSDIEIESDRWGQDYQFSTYVASPSQDMVEAETSLGAFRGDYN